MQASALTDANGDFLVAGVAITGLKKASDDRRGYRADVWSRKLNTINEGSLGDLIDNHFFGLLAHYLANQGHSLETRVTYGRAIRGGLRMIRCNGAEYREHQRKIYVR